VRDGTGPTVRRGGALILAAAIGCAVACATPPQRPAHRSDHAEGGAFPQGRAGPSAAYPSPISVGRVRGARGSVRVRGAALAELRRAGRLATAPGAWVDAGPTNIGGRATAIVDPNNPDRLWLGTAAGGVFRSDDDGVNWTALFDGQTALAIGSLAVHPTDSDTVYVGTGEDNGAGLSYDGEGVFRTTDGGSTWTDLGLAEVRRIGRIAVDPVRPQRLFVAAGGDWFNRDPHRGIYRSLDAGATWQKVLYVADDAGGIDVAIDPADPDRIYAALWQRQAHGATWSISGPQSGVWRSTDGGATWTRLAGGLPSGADVGRIGLALAPSSPNVLYARVINGAGGRQGIYRSTDGGNNWASLNPAMVPFTFAYYFGNIRVDPEDPDTVYVLDVHLFESTDGGATFLPIATHVHPDWHDLVIRGRRLLGANDAGFCRSRNGGSSWVQSATLPITQFYDLGIDPLDARRIFGGSQDNGVVRTQTGGLSDWAVGIEGDGLQCEVDGANPALVYAERQYGDLQRSIDGGATYTAATTGLAPAERRNWNMPITLDPQVPGTLYTGLQRVHRSTDGALSWSPISLDLTNGAAAAAAASRAPAGSPGADHAKHLVRGTITVVGVAPADHQVLWAGTDDGNIWVSEDAGSSWRNVTPPGPAYWVTDLAGDPFDRRAAWLSVSGYGQGDRMPYVRATTDLGVTWSERSATLPQIPVECILPDPEWRGRLYAGSDLGVHLSDDGGASWSLMNGGMPYVPVLDLVRHDPTRTLYAATHGRSIYAYDLRQLPVADGDGDGVDNNSDCALADPGVHASPPEVGTLTVEPGETGAAVLAWPSLADAAGTGTVYDVATGEIAALPAGAGVYYIVRGRNVCGASGWGRDSAGRDRLIAVCP